jgi:hypothetical protein
VTPSDSNLHITYHNKDGAYHPINDPQKTFQIVEQQSLH